MALKIRRGLEADLPLNPEDGELLYSTDTNKLFVGFGGSANEVTSSGIVDVISDTTPQLGGNLDVNGKEIVSVSNGNIVFRPNGTGQTVFNNEVKLNGNIVSDGQINLLPGSIVQVGNNAQSIDGNLYIVRNTYSSGLTAGLVFAQHHTTADAVNMTFFRSRGTGLAPAAVQVGDEIGEIEFASWDGALPTVAGRINLAVEGSVTSGRVPSKFVFVTNSSVNTAVRAELSSTGVWKVNSIQNLTGTELTLTSTTVKVVGDMQINAQGDLKFADADSSNYVAFQAPATVASNITWTLPATDGTNGQVLTTNGTGTLTWTTASGGGVLPSRTTINGNTGSISNGATGNFSITGFKAYYLLKVAVTHASWVRIYTDEASRLADSGRLEGTDPLPGSGVIAEIITTGSETVLISPALLGFNNETIPTSAIPIAVTNKSGASATITVTLTLLQAEV